MSLINDALKRVKRQTPPDRPKEMADYPFRPVDYEEPSHRFPLIFAALGVLVLLVGSGLLFFKWSGGHPRPETSRETPTGSAGAPASSEPGSDGATPGTRAGSERPRAIAAPKGFPTNAPAATAGASTNQGFPVLKLQGIYYKSAKPSALINGETVEEGESIEEVRVKKIDRKAVTLEWRGQVKVLTLR